VLWGCANAEGLRPLDLTQWVATERIIDPGPYCDSWGRLNTNESAVAEWLDRLRAGEPVSSWGPNGWGGGGVDLVAMEGPEGCWAYGVATNGRHRVALARAAGFRHLRADVRRLAPSFQSATTAVVQRWSALLDSGQLSGTLHDDRDGYMTLHLDPAQRFWLCYPDEQQRHNLETAYRRLASLTRPREAPTPDPGGGRDSARSAREAARGSPAPDSSTTKPTSASDSERASAKRRAANRRRDTGRGPEASRD